MTDSERISALETQVVNHQRILQDLTTATKKLFASLTALQDAVEATGNELARRRGSN